MYTKSLLVASLAVSAATANHIYPAHNRMRRDLVQARQTSGADASAVMSAGEACMTDLASAYASMPTQPAGLVEWEQTVVVTDPCAFTIPQSISSALVEYESEVEAWYKSHSAAIASALSECPSYSSYGLGGGDGYSSYSDICATGGSGGHAGGSDATTTTGGSGGSKTTATGGSGGSKTTATNNGGSGTTATTGATTAATKNAGPKETAVLGAAALAVAGVLGVVAAL